MTEPTPEPQEWNARARRKFDLGWIRGRSVVAVAIGGGIGAWCRYELTLRFAPTSPPALPTVTLGINLVGSFLLGFLLTLVLEYWPPTRYVRSFAAIGILGGFTTFSTFVVETDRLFGAGLATRAVLYLAVTLFGGLVAVALGSATATLWPRLFGRRRQEDPR